MDLCHPPADTKHTCMHAHQPMHIYTIINNNCEYCRTQQTSDVANLSLFSYADVLSDPSVLFGECDFIERDDVPVVSDVVDLVLSEVEDLVPADIMVCCRRVRDLLDVKVAVVELHFSAVAVGSDVVLVIVLDVA